MEVKRAARGKGVVVNTNKGEAMKGDTQKNVRGLNDPDKAKDINNVRVENNLCLLALLETKVRIDKYNYIRSLRCRDWEHTNNYEADNYGRIWVCWNPVLVNVQKMEASDQLKTSPFWFFDGWIHLAGFMDVVSEGWDIDFNYNPMLVLIHKLFNLKNKLRIWVANSGSDLHKREKQLLKKYGNLARAELAIMKRRSGCD
ncbi:hypothetical protein FRX31_026093 [Thalictrum thalictroides]|uniref:Uncharacterized protein n=1 Tax=Thalictrum thalictroides TaxID=46969 RepID=A0A7J6VHW8_THATH|nr:hypothetical protein FRX31_026093 [Thalictrum thalictroides]